MWWHVFGENRRINAKITKAKVAKMSISIFKPKVDSRYDKGHIVSHNKDKMISFIIDNPKEIINASVNHDVVGIDETQFFDHSIVDVCRKLASDKKE